MLSNATKSAARAATDGAEHDIKRTLKDTVGQVQHDLENTLDHASDYAGEAGKKVRGAVDKTVHNVKAATGHLTDEIKHKPVQSSLLALGAGFVLGSLVRR
jgi:ElaB/YqjD/DUF883 family membrane-anchored ribosome-binding protein